MEKTIDKHRNGGFIRIGIVGIGSCCSSFLQTLAANKNKENQSTGISHAIIGGYALADLQVVAGFDVDARKIGRDLSVAALDPSNAAVIHAPLEPFGFCVDPGPVLDGTSGPLRNLIPLSSANRSSSGESVVAIIKNRNCEVIVCCLPTGADEAVKCYATAAAEAGAAFINCTPSPAARDATTVRLFEQRRLPLLGDDLRSHVGATALHAMILELLSNRGVEVIETHQINIGGNADFLNLSDASRSKTKVESKQRALLAANKQARTFWAGPNGYVAGLGDRKVCHISITGRSLLDSKITIDLKLEVEDSPNAAAVMINAVRVAALARIRRIGGVVHAVSSLLFKSAPDPTPPSKAESDFLQFIQELP